METVPRFFFDQRIRGWVLYDGEGEVFASVAEAMAHAETEMIKLVAERLEKGRRFEEEETLVRTEEGEIAGVVRASARNQSFQ